MFRNHGKLTKILIWAMLIIGAVSFITPSAHAAPADTILSIPYSSQYQGQATQNFDCGPASIAMILEYFYGIPISGDSITQVRNTTGNTGAADTNFSDLESILSAYGLPYSEISSNLSPPPTAQIQAMEQAINAGNPVIALIHGADLGRGQQYGDHWVVVTGFSSDGQTVYLNDPDNQAQRLPGWIQGGQITLSLSVFQQAAYDASYGPYGIIINPPTWNF
jgi:ABC-type bacteriocin/lantibiotic exporter with double-glycine peptidase domain